MQLIQTMPVSPDLYAASDYHQRVARPATCPHCGTQRTLRALGYYSRNLTNSQGIVLRIRVRRFRCYACEKTLSILPSFAQPYKLVLSSTIDAFFRGDHASGVLRWRPLLRQYWKRFMDWIPEISALLGSLLGRAPPPTSGARWWKILVAAFGSLEHITRQIVERFQVTLFGRYRCHSPNLEPSALV